MADSAVRGKYMARHRRPPKKRNIPLLGSSSGARAFWNFADQAVSSLSNALMSIVAARLTTADDFGRFAVAFSVYGFTVGVSKALAATPFIIASTTKEDSDWRANGERGAGVALVTGVALMALICGVVAVLQNSFSLPIAVMALALPGLFVQDFWRTALIAKGRPAAATFNDALWVLGAAGAIYVCVVTHSVSPWTLILAWAAGGWIAALLGIRQWPGWPRIRGAKQHLASSWKTTKFLLWEYVAVSGATQAVWLVVPAVASAAAVGAVRGGLTLLGPLYIASTALGTFALTELLRKGTPSPRLATRTAVGLTAGIAVLDIVWGGAMYLMPTAWGRGLLGDSWDASRATIIPLTINNVAIAASTGPMIAMRAYADTKRTFRVYLGFGPTMLICALIGAKLAEGEGAAWGYAVSALLFAPAWWIALRGCLAVQRSVDPQVSP